MSMATTMTALATASGLARTYDYPAQSVEVPCAVIGYPTMDPTVTFTTDRSENVYPVYVLAGSLSDRQTRQAIDGYLHSVPTGIEALTSATIDYCHVDSVKLARIPVAGVDYLGIVFSVIVMEVI